MKLDIIDYDNTHDMTPEDIEANRQFVAILVEQGAERLGGDKFDADSRKRVEDEGVAILGKLDTAEFYLLGAVLTYIASRAEADQVTKAVEQALNEGNTDKLLEVAIEYGIVKPDDKVSEGDLKGIIEDLIARPTHEHSNN